MKAHQLSQNTAMTMIMVLLDDLISEKNSQRFAANLLELAGGDGRLAVRAAEIIADGQAFKPAEAVSLARQSRQQPLFTR